MARILVIDDDRNVLATIKLLLEREAHDVVASPDSRTGLDLFEASSFDLLIVDIFMPGMDGIETMKLVHQRRPEMPVVVISGQEFRTASERAPDFLLMATRLGAVSSVQKPFRPRDLLSAVGEALAKARAASSDSPTPRG